MKERGSSKSPTTRVWGALDLELPEVLHDRLFAALPEACLGVETHAGDGGNARITAYFGSEEAAARTAGELATLLGAAGSEAAVSLRAGVRAVEDGGWVERYQASLRPFDVGRRFSVHPAGAAHASSGRLTISLTPGRAFGTGEHPTTRLCIAALEQCVAQGDRWLDLGCGSGILSVVAAKCGAASVCALDLDPDAVVVARETIRLNGVERQVRLARGGERCAATGCWHGVVVNISGAFIERAAERLAALPAPGGLLVASGFLEGERERVARALGRERLRPSGEETLDGWGAAMFRRPSGGAR